MKPAADIAEEKLIDALNILAYTTNRKFALKKLKRLIDWTPGIVERNAIIYAERPVWDSAEPALEQKFVDSSIRLLANVAGEKQRLALRWYRLGIKERSLEHQFSLFWFALEIAAEATKDPAKVASKCPICQGTLFCQTCNTHPTHRPYRGQVIQRLIERVHPTGSKEIFKTLQRIRHALMHGDPLASLELPCTREQAVTKLAAIAHHAIFCMFKSLVESEELHMGYVDDVTHRNLVVAFQIKTRLLRGDLNDPQLEDFPTIQAQINEAPQD